MNRASTNLHRARQNSLRRAALIAATFLAALALSTPPGRAATLQELFDGAALVAGNARFSDWELISSDSTGAIPDLAQIVASPLAADPLNPGIQFSGTGRLAVSGINAIDIVLKFRVAALPGSNTFTGHSLDLSSITFGGSGGIAFVSDEVVGGVGDLGSALAIVDHETDFLQLQSSTAFAPHSQLSVTTNIFLTGLSGGDAINLATFAQHFLQYGTPGVTGDYNQNGAVDAADYVVWRRNVGTANALANDNIGGTIGAAHYNQWRSRFGHAAGSGSAALASAAVPEPATPLMLILGMAAINRRSLRFIA